MITDKVLMIRPAKFFANPETALDNSFQITPSSEDGTQQAQQEFDQLRQKIQDAGIRVCVVQDTSEPQTPDSVFPNNQVSFHANGIAVHYPMKAPSRRKERALDYFSALKKDHFFELKTLIDYSDFEDKEQFLEGTGSMILDRQNKQVFAAISQRTHKRPLEQFCRDFGYELIAFEAGLTIADQFVPIYHTNVLMALGEDFAVVALDCIKDPQQAKMLSSKLSQSGRNLISITNDQMQHFCGNILQFKNSNDQRVILMSSTAYHHFSEQQRQILSRHSRLVHSDISTIENASGGSVRCMLAEVF